MENAVFVVLDQNQNVIKEVDAQITSNSSNVYMFDSLLVNSYKDVGTFYKCKVWFDKGSGNNTLSSMSDAIPSICMYFSSNVSKDFLIKYFCRFSVIKNFML